MRIDSKKQRRFPPFKALRAFESAARHQSLSGASLELNVSRSAISQQIKLLEGFLEAKLFERRGSHLTLTEHANNYHPLLTEMFDALHQGTQSLFGKNEKHTLSIRVAQSFCHAWLLPRLGDFHRCYPDINIKFQTTTNLYPNTNNSVDIEIINGYGNWQDKTIYKLTTHEQWLAVASPSFIKKYDFNRSIDHIAHYPKIETSGYSEGWKEWFHSQVLGLVFTPSLFTFDSTQLSIEAAIQGNGMLLAKSIFVDDNLKQGELVLSHQHKMISKSHHYLIINPNQESHYKVIAFKRWLLASLNH